MSSFEIDDDEPILVEMTMTSQPGMKQVSLTPAETAQKSKEAINSAMNTIGTLG
jgi:hypothetical protein